MIQKSPSLPEVSSGQSAKSVWDKEGMSGEGKAQIGVKSCHGNTRAFNASARGSLYLEKNLSSSLLSLEAKRSTFGILQSLYMGIGTRSL